MTKKTLPLILVLIGAALLITAAIFWVDSLTTIAPESFGQSLRDWITLVVGIGASIKGWMDLLKKDASSHPTQNVHSGNILSGTFEKVGEDFVGGDKVVNTYFSDDVSYNVEGLPNPYLGLRAFSYNDRDLYTGREKLVEEALRMLTSAGGQRELLFVTGASGSGKSSFVQAGLLPAIFKYYEEKKFKVDFTVFRPSLTPRERLFKVVRDLSSREIQIIVIDQFEELFTQSTVSERNAVLRYLSNLESFEISRRHILATMRSDYLGEIHDNPVLFPIATRGIPLRAMKTHELKATIQRPLVVKYPNKNKRFDPKLVEKLAQDAAESVTYLPLLQVTLEEIWNKGHLRLSEYSSLIDSIKEWADTVLVYRDFDNATPREKRLSKERDQIVTILLGLVNVSLEKEVRHDTSISRERSEFSEEQQGLLDELSEARLISIDREDDKDIVNLIHETLLQNWDVLQNGVKEKRVQLENRVNFETHLREWIRRNRSNDYLLKKEQIAEAQELEKVGDIALSKSDAQDFLQESIRKLDADTRRDYILSTLLENFIALSSTLDLVPLLQKILEKAAGISDCESGVLFLVDDKTGDLVSEAVIGSVSKDQIGQRISLGEGVVGRAAQTRAPIIDNNSLTFLSLKDGDNREFIPRFILAVPMLIKNRLIGVIVVANKKNKLPFVNDDQNWLSLFANQATAAVETARLHALADRDIARMEKERQEYEQMQRIERQLSASVDIDRAAEITLEWAVRQSNAEAGLIGMVENDHLRLMAQKKYDQQAIERTKVIFDLESTSLRDAIDSGQSKQISLYAKGEQGMFPTAQYRLIVPIQREARIIGLLILECTTELQQNLKFLNRLCDYAAITISKAQLIDEAQRANLAKSDFISFVAHEIKNPNTSIKGYVELLATGAVGPVNEMQINFLNTIRANTLRMSAIISNLNDNAKIEVGRLPLEFRNVNLADVVDEELSYIKLQLEEKKQILDLRLPKQLPQVWADRTRIGQVLTNLITNANKYTPEGGEIIVSAENSNNLWDSDDTKRVVHLWVKDNGIGINMEDQAKVFQKFFRSSDPKAREAPGTGLGLNIAKSLIEMMGGRIWFESEFRKGTTFHFTVPVAEG